MKVAIPETVGYILPIGDVHLDSPEFGKVAEQKLTGYLKWAREHNARIPLLGDIFNVATRQSKTEPWGAKPRAMQRAVDLFGPYADLIVGAVDGNHEYRSIDFMGMSPTEALCQILKVPYCGWSMLLRVQVGQRQERWFHNTYNLFVHHTTGGGRLQSALAPVMRLEQVIDGCDVYLGGHNHQLITGKRQVWRPSPSRPPQLHTVHYASCGSFCEWDGSYAEMKGLPPSQMGTARVRLDGSRDKHDVHISI